MLLLPPVITHAEVPHVLSLFREKLQQVFMQTATTMLLVSHDLEEAVYLAERILVLSNKPTTIKEEVVVDLPRPRDFSDPKFVAIRNYVTESIKWW